MPRIIARWVRDCRGRLANHIPSVAAVGRATAAAWVEDFGCWPNRQLSPRLLGLQSWQRAELRVRKGQDLEQFAHLIRRSEARERCVDIGGLLRCRVLLQPRGARFDAEAAQEFTLRKRAVHAHT